MVTSRQILFVLILVAAFGLPYVLMKNDVFGTARNMWNSLWARSPVAQPLPRDRDIARGPGGKQPVSEPATSAEKTVRRLREIAARTVPQDRGGVQEWSGPTVSHPAQLFRFDVQPEWIGRHWSRVTALPHAGGLEEMRVPISTGTGPHDIAGSMSYCFDSRREVQRVSFSGTTYDPSPLVGALSRHYGLQVEPSVGGRLYTSGGGESAQNAIFVNLSHRGGIQNSIPMYRVEIELNRPGQTAGASDWLRALLARHVVRSSGDTSPSPTTGTKQSDAARP